MEHFTLAASLVARVVVSDDLGAPAHSGGADVLGFLSSVAGVAAGVAGGKVCGGFSCKSCNRKFSLQKPENLEEHGRLVD